MQWICHSDQIPDCVPPRPSEPQRRQKNTMRSAILRLCQGHSSSILTPDLPNLLFSLKIWLYQEWTALISWWETDFVIAGFRIRKLWTQDYAGPAADNHSSEIVNPGRAERAHLPRKLAHENTELLWQSFHCSPHTLKKSPFKKSDSVCCTFAVIRYRSRHSSAG